ncbi:Sulfatase [uncultured archaeon]|nr:Sulfatase [uncultured archaeon]
MYGGRFPATARLMKESTYFTNAISSAPLTPISHASILTGLQPRNHGVRHLFRERIRRNAKMIQQILQENGYVTGAIVSCPGMNRWYGFSRGFETYDDEIPRLPDGSDPLNTVDVKLRGLALKPANKVSERATAWLERNGRSPFALFIHFFDAHWPYSAPKGFGGANAYENSLAFVDYHLGVVLKKLEELGLDKNTTVVCFSDHGEDLNGLYENDKGGKRLGHPEELGHGCLLYDQTQKVVLIIRDAGFSKNREIRAQARLVDIFPTVLDLLKIKYDGHVDGISLLQNAKIPRIAYSETFFPDELDKKRPEFSAAVSKKAIRIENKYKIIFNIGSDEVEVYDLENDPHEQRNLNI